MTTLYCRFSIIYTHAAHWTLLQYSEIWPCKSPCDVVAGVGLWRAVFLFGPTRGTRHCLLHHTLPAVVDMCKQTLRTCAYSLFNNTSANIYSEIQSDWIKHCLHIFIDIHMFYTKRESSVFMKVCTDIEKWAHYVLTGQNAVFTPNGNITRKRSVCGAPVQ